MIARPTPALLGAAALAALALSGCGSSSSSSSSTTAAPAQTGAGSYGTPATPAATPSGSVVKLSADPTGRLRFNVTTLHAKAGAVSLQMTNPTGSGTGHGISVQGNGVDKDSSVVQAGGTATVTATLKPGTYTFYCPVPGHEAAGMKGTLTVT
jgi:uncharacterized cupredoxin-like copper-binding protein